MAERQSNNKRIAKNTFMLYIRMLVMTIVSLFTSRIVLQTLGVTDFGIFNVVGGIVAMLGFLNSSMANAVQRFFSFEIGRGDKDRIKHVFNVAMTAHIAIAIVVFLLIEIFGTWYLNTVMIIPENRIIAANWVLQCTIITTVFSIIQVPYNGIIIANEQMNIYAYISILEAFFRLAIVYLLLTTTADRLIVYAILMSVVSIIILSLNRIYCIKRFPESHLKFIHDKKLLKEITSFASWNMLGEIAWVMTGSGVNLIINIFYGPVLNAARGLAEQVNAAVMRFINNFQTALNPQLIKSYSVGQIEEMKNLLYRGSRFSYYVLFVLALPLILEMEFILGLWLHDIPEHTTLFCQLILICSLTASVSNLLAQVARAYGAIRKYQLVVSLFLLLNFPLSYIILKMGFAAELTVVVNISIQAVLLFIRLLLVRPMIGLSIWQFTKSVVWPIMAVTAVSSVIPVIWKSFSETSILSSITTIIIALLSSVFTIFFMGISNRERQYLLGIIKHKSKAV